MHELCTKMGRFYSFPLFKHWQITRRDKEVIDRVGEGHVRKYFKTQQSQRTKQEKGKRTRAPTIVKRKAMFTLVFCVLKNTKEKEDAYSKPINGQFVWRCKNEKKWHCSFDKSKKSCSVTQKLHTFFRFSSSICNQI